MCEEQRYEVLERRYLFDAGAIGDPTQNWDLLATFGEEIIDGAEPQGLQRRTVDFKGSITRHK
jgi:hypothetical protein